MAVAPLAIIVHARARGGNRADWTGRGASRHTLLPECDGLERVFKPSAAGYRRERSLARLSYCSWMALTADRYRAKLASSRMAAPPTSQA